MEQERIPVADVGPGDLVAIDATPGWGVVLDRTEVPLGFRLTVSDVLSGAEATIEVDHD